MSASSKPRLAFTNSHVLNRHDSEIRQLFALVRSRTTPTAVQTPILGTAAPSSVTGIIYPFTEPGQDYGNVSFMTVNIDLSAPMSGYTKMTLTGNIALAFNNAPAAGNHIDFYLDFTQDGVGGRTVTFPGTVANPPTINSAANSRTLVLCSTFDGGTTYIAVALTSATGSFANTSLSNLANPTDINQHLRPNAASTFDLGTDSPDRSWHDLFIDRIRLRAAGTIINNAAMITTDASDNIIYNVATGDKHSFTINGAELGRIDSSGFTTLQGITAGGSIITTTALQAVGSFFVNNTTCDISSTTTNINSSIINLGDTVTDRIDFEGRVGTDIDPNSAGLRDLGSPSLPWRDLDLAGVLRGVDVILTGELDMTGGDDILLGGSNYIRFGASVSSASAGTRTLPPNPAGFFYVKDPGGNLRLVPYYNP